MAREIRPIAPILPAAKEENLDAGLSAFLMGGDDVGIDHSGNMDVLVPLDERQRADSVTKQRRRLEIQRVRGPFHLGGEPLLNIVAPAGQKGVRLLDQRCVILAGDVTDARGAAPFDLVQQARANAGGKNAVAARPQQERLLQGHQSAIDRPGGGERTEIAAFLGSRAAVFRELRKVVTGGEMDKRERFVIAQ